MLNSEELSEERNKILARFKEFQDSKYQAKTKEENEQQNNNTI
jgi:hypothetical protein